MSSYTRGPLKVTIWPEWPFYIDTHDESGELVFRTSMPMYSTKQKTVGDVLTGAYMSKYTDEAIRTNARALADEMLRAAAPELLEACLAMVEWDEREKDHAVSFEKRLELCERAFQKARVGIAKALGTTEVAR